VFHSFDALKTSISTPKSWWAHTGGRKSLKKKLSTVPSVVRFKKTDISKVSVEIFSGPKQGKKEGPPLK